MTTGGDVGPQQALQMELRPPPGKELTHDRLCRIDVNSGDEAFVGIVKGTPIADRYEKLCENLSPGVAFFDCAKSDGQELASLTAQASKAWLSANPPPGSLRYDSIVAHAAPSETAVLLRPLRGVLDDIDPRNDGQVIATDAILPGSTLLAEARADHWDIALPRDRHPSAVFRAMTSVGPTPARRCSGR